MACPGAAEGACYLTTVTEMVWVQLPVWSDYLCARNISDICFQTNTSDWQEGSMVSSIIGDCWWHVKLVALQRHQG